MQHFVAEDTYPFWRFWPFFGDFQTTKICLDSKPSAEYSAKSDWRRLWSRRQKRQIGSCENSSVATIFSWFFWSFQYFLPVFKCPFRWFLKRPSVKVLRRPKTKFDTVEPSHALILCDEWKAGWTRFLEDGDPSCKRDKRICRGRGRQSHCHLCYKGKFEIL